MVLLPAQGEQMVVAQRLAAQGLGMAGPRRGDPAFDHAELVERALGDPALAVAATAIAARYSGFDPAAAIAQVAGAYETVLSG
jgi:UDP:flavonoid glycosyltransferase YjiC (YdhE family)